MHLYNVYPFLSTPSFHGHAVVLTGDQYTLLAYPLSDGAIMDHGFLSLQGKQISLLSFSVDFVDYKYMIVLHT